MAEGVPLAECAMSGHCLRGSLDPANQRFPCIGSGRKYTAGGTGSHTIVSVQGARTIRAMALRVLLCPVLSCPIPSVVLSIALVRVTGFLCPCPRLRMRALRLAGSARLPSPYG